LQQDDHGCNLLDVNPTCYHAIVEYLNEMMISSEDNPSNPPSSVRDECKHILRHELFGLSDKVPKKVELPNSNINIIKDARHF